MPTPPPGRAKRTLAKLPLILFGFLIGALLAEVGLRLVGYSYPEFYQPDPTRGYALRPGMEGWYQKEGAAYIQINHDGLRDREHAKAKPENTFRIAVLGDSYPEAFNVSREEAFWAVMERELQKCGAFPNKQIEVINFGVSGYGTAQELITLREHVWDYSPDVVMLAITTNNDITDNSLVLKRTHQIPFFVYRKGKLVLDDSFQNTRTFRFQQSAIGAAARWVRDHSRLVQSLGEAQRAFRVFTAARRSRPKASNAPPQVGAQVKGGEKSDIVTRSEELGTDNVVYLETGDPVWQDAWAVTEGLIVLMRDEVRSKGAKFLVLTLSNGPQVFPAPAVRQGFMQRFAVTDLFYPDKRIKSLSEREGIPSLILAPELQAYADKNRVFLHGFGQNMGEGHWNSTGHRVAGELIAEKLCSGGLLK